MLAAHGQLPDRYRDECLIPYQLLSVTTPGLVLFSLWDGVLQSRRIIPVLPILRLLFSTDRGPSAADNDSRPARCVTGVESH